MAGLLSAAVLSRHFEDVLIVEAEELLTTMGQTDGGTPRNSRARVRQYLQVGPRAPLSTLVHPHNPFDSLTFS